MVLTRSSNEEENHERGFSIDFEGDTFLMDGKPFRYVAGSFHYFRALPQTWRQKLKTLKAGGLNAVDLYIQWSLHNPEDGVYNWEGIADVEQVVKIATEEELYVILRPGPYVSEISVFEFKFLMNFCRFVPKLIMVDCLIGLQQNIQTSKFVQMTQTIYLK